MAATGVRDQNIIVFAGGSSNPYNYNGVGYDGNPSEPVKQLWLYDIAEKKWQVNASASATMDHRGLLKLDHQLLIIGGMGPTQQVLNKVTQISL